MQPTSLSIDYGGASNRSSLSESSSEDAAYAVEEFTSSMASEPKIVDEEEQRKLLDLKYLGQNLDAILDGLTVKLPRYEDSKFWLTFGAKRIAKGLKSLFEAKTRVFIIFFPAPDLPCEPVPSVPESLIEVDRIIEPTRDRELAHERALVEFGQHHVRVARLRAAMEDIAMHISRNEDDEMTNLMEDYFSRYERALMLIEEIMKESALYEEFMSSPELLREAEERQQERDVEEYMTRITSQCPPVPDVKELCRDITPEFNRPPPPIRQPVLQFPGTHWQRSESQSRLFVPIQGSSTSSEGSPLNSPDSGLPHSPPPVNEELARIHAACSPLEPSMCNSDDDCTASQCSTSRESSPILMADALQAQRVKQELRAKVRDLIGEENVKERRRPEQQKSVEEEPPQSEELACEAEDSEETSSDPLHLSREDGISKTSPDVEDDYELKRRNKFTALMVDQSLRDEYIAQKKAEAAQQKDEKIEEETPVRKAFDSEAAAKKQAAINKRFALIMSLANQRLDREVKACQAREEAEQRRVKEEMEHRQRQQTLEWQQHLQYHQLPATPSSAFSPPSLLASSFSQIEQASSSSDCSSSSSLAGAHLVQQQQHTATVSWQQRRRAERAKQEAINRKQIAREEKEKKRKEEELKRDAENAKEAAEQRKKVLEERAIREAEEEAERERAAENKAEEDRQAAVAAETEAQRLKDLDADARRTERREREEKERKKKEEEDEEKKRKQDEQRLAAAARKREEEKTVEEKEKEKKAFEAERRKLQKEEAAQLRAEANRANQALAAQRQQEEKAKMDLSEAQRVAQQLEEIQKKKEELEAVVAATLLTPPVTPDQPKTMSKSARRRAKKTGSRLQSAVSTETINSMTSSAYSNEPEESHDGDEPVQQERDAVTQERFEVAASRSSKKKNDVKFVPSIYAPPQPEANEEDKRTAETRKAYWTQHAREQRRIAQTAHASRETTPESANGSGDANKKIKYKKERVPEYSPEFLEERRREETPPFAMNPAWIVLFKYAMLGLFFFIIVSIWCSIAAHGGTVNYLGAITTTTPSNSSTDADYPDYRLPSPEPVSPAKSHDVDKDDSEPPEKGEKADCLLWVFKPGPFGAALCVRTPHLYRLSTFHDDTILALADQESTDVQEHLEVYDACRPWTGQLYEVKKTANGKEIRWLTGMQLNISKQAYSEREAEIAFEMVRSPAIAKCHSKLCLTPRKKGAQCEPAEEGEQKLVSCYKLRRVIARLTQIAYLGYGESKLMSVYNSTKGANWFFLWYPYTDCGKRRSDRITRFNFTHVDKGITAIYEITMYMKTPLPLNPRKFSEQRRDESVIYLYEVPRNVGGTGNMEEVRERVLTKRFDEGKAKRWNEIRSRLMKKRPTTGCGDSTSFEYDDAALLILSDR